MRGAHDAVVEPRPMWSISPHSHAFPALDGLRGVAVALVLVVHAAGGMLEPGDANATVRGFWDALAPLVRMGGTGVHLFFVLSGFLLFLPFARHLLVEGRRPSVRHFYKRRLMRIIPAYYVALVVVWAVFERDTIVEPVKQFVTHALLVHNYSLDTYKGLDGPTWTMAVEAQFYALLPLLGAAGVWLLSRSRRALVVGAVALVLSSPAASVLAVLLKRVVPGFEDHATILSTFHFMSTFGCGILAACVYTLARAGRLDPSRQHAIARGGLGVFVVLFATYAFRDELGLTDLVDFRDYYLFALAMGVAYAGLLLHVVLSPEAAPARVLSRPSIRFLGDVSYSVYLLHLPIQYQWLGPWGSDLGGAWPLVVMIGGTLLVVIPVATLSFWFVERPFLARK